MIVSAFAVVNVLKYAQLKRLESVKLARTNQKTYGVRLGKIAHRERQISPCVVYICDQINTYIGGGDGRKTKKKTEYDKEKQLSLLLSELADAYEQVGTIRTLATELNITPLKLRKLLITAGVFSSDICEEVNTLYQDGKKLKEIIEITGLSRASVHSYLPYTKGIYNAEELSLDAEKCRVYRMRREKLEKLQQSQSEENLQQAIIVFQNYLFKTATGLPFRYTLKKGKDGTWNRELFINRREQSKSLAWSSVRLAYQNACEKKEEINKPKNLGDIRGVSYTYSILWRFGIIKVPEKVAIKMTGQGIRR